MDKYLNITKPIALQEKRRHAEKDPHKRDVQAMQKMTEKERIMHIATTATTSGHDIWQSASTGHQVSESGGKSVSYNDARLAKLQAQFPAHLPLKRPRHSLDTHKPDLLEQEPEPGGRDSSHISLFDYDAEKNLYHPSQVSPSSHPTLGSGGIFSGCVFYLDGYMGPKMSDHTLRRTLTRNGGVLSMYLKKTRITHVLLSDSGALANSKIRREVEGSRNRVKFVKVEWVHKCLEAGKRVGEWEYSIDRLCGKNKSAAAMFASIQTPAVAEVDSSTDSIYTQESKLLSSSVQSQQEAVQEAFLEKQALNLLDAEEGERLDGLDR